MVTFLVLALIYCIIDLGSESLIGLSVFLNIVFFPYILCQKHLLFENEVILICRNKLMLSLCRIYVRIMFV